MNLYKHAIQFFIHQQMFYHSTHFKAAFHNIFIEKKKMFL